MLVTLSVLSVFISSCLAHGWHGYGGSYISSRTRFKIEQLLWEVAFVADDITLELITPNEGETFLNGALTDDFEYERSGFTLNKTSFVGFLAFGLSFRGWHYLVGTPPLYLQASHNTVRLRINDFVVSPQELGDTGICRQDFTGEAIFFTFRRSGWSNWKISRIENNIAHNQRQINSTFDCPTSPAPAAKKNTFGNEPLISEIDFIGDSGEQFHKVATGAGVSSNQFMLMIGMFSLNIVFFMMITIKLFCFGENSSGRTNKYKQISNFSSGSEMES